MNAITKIQQHVDVEIPDIEIADGWSVDDIQTLDDSDDAFAVLTAACAGIEAQIEAEPFKPLAELRGQWVANAKAALRYKKAALAIVQTKRTRINAANALAMREAEERATFAAKMEQIKARNTEASQLLGFIRSCVPPKQWLEWVTAHNAASQVIE